MKTNHSIILFLMVVAMAFGVSGAWAAPSPDPVTISVESKSDVTPSSSVSIGIIVTNPEGIAGASFTVNFNPALTLTDVQSSFFPTFAAQWTLAGTDPVPDTSVTVGAVTYNQPMVTNPNTGTSTDPDGGSNTTGSVKIAAARYAGGETGTTLLTLTFTVPASGGPFNVWLSQTSINNTDAGYDSGGELIPWLVATDETEPDISQAFADIVTTNTNHSGNPATITLSSGITDVDGDGIDDGWETTHFGNLTTADGHNTDFDQDGYSDKDEYDNSTDPKDWDPAGGTGYSSSTALGDEMIADFNDSGLYHYYGTWNRISTANANGLDNYMGDLAVNFPGVGIYLYDGSWTRISTNNAEQMFANDSYLYIDFGAFGLYKYVGGTWTRVSTGDPSGFTIYNGDLVVNFPGVGIYLFNGSVWTKISTNNAQAFVQVGANLFIDFGTLGLYKFNSGMWTKVSTSDADGLSAYIGNLVVNFPGFGIYLFNGTVWNRISTNNSQQAVQYGASLYVDFGSSGLYRYNSGTWTKVSTSNPERIAVIGDVLVVDFGTAGLYQLDFSGVWTKLSTANIDDCVDVDILP